MDIHKKRSGSEPNFFQIGIKKSMPNFKPKSKNRYIRNSSISNSVLIN